MIVTCEKCNDRFTLDETALESGGSKVQCSSCKHVFTVFPPQEAKSTEEDELDEILRDLTLDTPQDPSDAGQKRAPSEERSPGPKAPDPEKETLFDAEEFDLSELSDLPVSGTPDKTDDGIDFELEPERPTEQKPASEPGQDDLEFVLGDDFEIDENLSAPQGTTGAGKIEFDLSDLEEILKTEREPKPGKKPDAEPEILLKEEPEEPPIEFDVEILDDTFPEETKVEAPERETEPEDLEETGVVDELDLTEYPEEAPAEAAAPAATPEKEETPEPEFKIDAEEPLETESRYPGAVEEKETKGRPKRAVEVHREEEPRVFESDRELPSEAQMPPETFSLPGKPRGARTALIVLLILALAGGAGYGAFWVKDRMGISTPHLSLTFLTDLFKSRVQDPGNLRIRILNVDGHFITSPEHGKRLVVSGKVMNDYEQARGEIRVTANLIKKDRQILESKTVYCGNLIPETDLVKMGMEAIDAQLARKPAADAVSARIQPRKTGAFMAVFGNLPRDLEEYTVTVGGSREMK